MVSNIQGVGLGDDLFKRHKGFPRLHASRAAPQAGLLVEAEEPLLEALVLERPQRSDRAEGIRCVNTVGENWQLLARREDTFFSTATFDLLLDGVPRRGLVDDLLQDTQLRAVLGLAAVSILVSQPRLLEDGNPRAFRYTRDEFLGNGP